MTPAPKKLTGITRAVASELYAAADVAFQSEHDSVKAFGAILMGRASMILSGKGLPTEIIPDKHLSQIEDLCKDMPERLWLPYTKSAETSR